MLRSTWRGLETWHGRDAVTPRNRKGEATGNTNFDLNRRASPRPYLWEPVGDHLRPERTGDHRANRGDRLQAWAQLARLVLLAQRSVERGDLSTDYLYLTYKDHQGCACCRGQALIALVTDDRRQLGEPEQASCRDDAELVQVCAHGVDQLRALTDQLRTRAVQHR